ncbi:MAG: hypothetical protein ACI9JN_001605 [Bacteroidia bacterium]|jgi:hypothetical protein
MCTTIALDFNTKVINMNAVAYELINQDKQKAASVALKTFFNIMEKWGVKNQTQMALLGFPSQGTFYKWKKGEASSISIDTLERCSYIMGIYKALGVLFPTRQQADAWPRKENEAFGGLSALDYMAKGSMVQLLETRRYLDAQRG